MNWIDDFEVGMTIHTMTVVEYLKSSVEDGTNEDDRAWERDGQYGLHGYLCDLVQPSGHDWAESVTVKANGRLRHEYRLTHETYAGHNMADGLTEEAILGFSDLDWLDDPMITRGQVVCYWCHLLTPVIGVECQNCEHPMVNQ